MYPEHAARLVLPYVLYALAVCLFAVYLLTLYIAGKRGRGQKRRRRRRYCPGVVIG